jgi:hypothetical protein
MQSCGILKLLQKVNFLLIFQTTDLQILVNFRHRKGHRFEFQSSGEWKLLKLWNKVRPLVSLSSRLNRSHPVIGRVPVTPNPSHSTLHATPRGQRSGHRTPRSSPPPRELRLILVLLRSLHDSPLSHTPASSCHGVSGLAMLCCHAAAPRASAPANAGGAAPRWPPQATPRRRFFRREHLSMHHLVWSSSDPTDTTTSSTCVLRRSPTSPSSPTRAPTAPHQRLLCPDRTPSWDRICSESSSPFHLKCTPYPATLL